MIKVLIWAFILVMIYRIIAKYVLPIFQVTRMAGERLHQMQQKIDEMDGKIRTRPSSPRPKSKDNDYIDYEEVK